MDKASYIFCAGALAGALALSAIGYGQAAMSPEEVARAHTPAAPETLPDVDLGEGFGRVAVIDLVGYYIDNPPAPAAGADPGAPAVRHFGGC